MNMCPSRKAPPELWLKGQVFFLWSNNIQNGQQIVRHAVEKIPLLGGRVETFLSRDITTVLIDDCHLRAYPYFTSNQPIKSVYLESNCIIPSTVNQSNFFNIPSTSQGYNNLLATPSNTPYRIISYAIHFGIAVWGITCFMQSIDPQLKSISHPKKRQNNNISLLSGTFIKFECQYKKFRPCFKIFNSDTERLMPLKNANILVKVDTCKNILSNPSTPKQYFNHIDRIATAVNESKPPVKAADKKTFNKLKPKDENNYCECCRAHYTDLKLHLKSINHQKFVHNEKNYETVNSIINTLPTTPQEFMEKCKKLTKPSKGTFSNNTTNANLINETNCSTINHSAMNTGTTSHSVMNGGITSHSIVNGGVATHSVVNGSTTNHSVVNGGTMNHSAVNRGIINHSIMNGGTVGHSAMNIRTIDHSVMNGRNIVQSAINGGTISHSTMDAGTTNLSVVNVRRNRHSVVNARINGQSAMNTGANSHSTINTGPVSHSAMNLESVNHSAINAGTLSYASMGAFFSYSSRNGLISQCARNEGSLNQPSMNGRTISHSLMNGGTITPSTINSAAVNHSVANSGNISHSLMSGETAEHSLMNGGYLPHSIMAAGPSHGHHGAYISPLITNQNTDFSIRSMGHFNPSILHGRPNDHSAINDGAVISPNSLRTEMEPLNLHVETVPDDGNAVNTMEPPSLAANSRGLNYEPDFDLSRVKTEPADADDVSPQPVPNLETNCAEPPPSDSQSISPPEIAPETLPNPSISNILPEELPNPIVPVDAPTSTSITNALNNFDSYWLDSVPNEVHDMVFDENIFELNDDRDSENEINDCPENIENFPIPHSPRQDINDCASPVQAQSSISLPILLNNAADIKNVESKRNLTDSANSSQAMDFVNPISPVCQPLGIEKLVSAGKDTSFEHFKMSPTPSTSNHLEPFKAVPNIDVSHVENIISDVSIPKPANIEKFKIAPNTEVSYFEKSNIQVSCTNVAPENSEKMFSDDSDEEFKDQKDTKSFISNVLTIIKSDNDMKAKKNSSESNDTSVRETNKIVSNENSESLKDKVVSTDQGIGMDLDKEFPNITNNTVETVSDIAPDKKSHIDIDLTIKDVSLNTCIKQVLKRSPSTLTNSCEIEIDTVDSGIGIASNNCEVKNIDDPLSTKLIDRSLDFQSSRYPSELGKNHINILSRHETELPSQPDVKSVNAYDIKQVLSHPINSECSTQEFKFSKMCDTKSQEVQQHFKHHPMSISNILNNSDPKVFEKLSNTNPVHEYFNVQALTDTKSFETHSNINSTGSSQSFQASNNHNYQFEKNTGVIKHTKPDVASIENPKVNYPVNSNHLKNTINHGEQKSPTDSNNIKCISKVNLPERQFLNDQIRVGKDIVYTLNVENSSSLQNYSGHNQCQLDRDTRQFPNCQTENNLICTVNNSCEAKTFESPLSSKSVGREYQMHIPKKRYTSSISRELDVQNDKRCSVSENLCTPVSPVNQPVTREYPCPKKIRRSLSTPVSSEGKENPSYYILNKIKEDVTNSRKRKRHRVSHKRKGYTKKTNSSHSKLYSNTTIQETPKVNYTSYRQSAKSSLPNVRMPPKKSLPKKKKIPSIWRVTKIRGRGIKLRFTCIRSESFETCDEYEFNEE